MLGTSSVEKGATITLSYPNSIETQASNGGVYVGTAYSDYFSQVRQTSDLGFVGVGSTARDPVGVRNGLVSKFYPDGTSEWFSKLGDQPGWMPNLQTVQETKDGGFVTCGFSATGFPDLDFRVYMVKFSGIGVQEWAYSFLEGSGFVSGIPGCIETRDETPKYAFLGSKNEGIYLVQMNSGGIEDWILTLSGVGYQFYPTSLIEASDYSGFVVAGLMRRGPTTRADIFLSKIFSNGVLGWTVTLGGPEDDSAFEVKETEDGGFVITGYSESYSEDQSKMLILAKFSPVGVFEWAKVLETASNGLSVSQTNDGGFFIVAENNLLVKTYKNGEACGDGWRDVTSSIVWGEIDNSELDSVFGAGVITDLSSVLDTETHTDLPENYGQFDVEKEDICEILFGCFGVYNESSSCSGHGNCTADDTCVCESPYFGEECGLFYCFDILNNYTSDVCNGHGRCVDVDRCDCDVEYGYNEDCTIWKCFGKFMNASNVCNGNPEFSDHVTSHGNCTSHDNCVCEERYRSSSSCDWACEGYESWLDEACGGHGICIDDNVCNCTNSSYTGEFCDEPNCAITNNDCSGHGVCEKPGVCTCSGNGVGLYEGYNCETWSCGGKDWEDINTCSGHGVCVEPNTCQCNHSSKNNDFAQYLGRDCEMKVGNLLVLSTKHELAMQFEVSEGLLRDYYGIGIGESFSCENKLGFVLNTERTRSLLSYVGRTTSEEESLLERLKTLISGGNCSFSRINEETDVSSGSQFLKIDIRNFPFSEYLSLLSSLQDGKIVVNVYDHHTLELEIFPSHHFLTRRDQKYTLKSYDKSDVSSDDDDEDPRKGPEGETQVCKSKLQAASDLCVDLYECYERQSEDSVGFQYFSVGFMPSPVSGRVFRYSKFYYANKGECENGVTVNNDVLYYKSFSLLRCYGSARFDDNFVMYRRCSNQLASLFFQSEVLGYFLATTSPLQLVFILLICLLCCCGVNCCLFSSRKVLRKFWKQSSKSSKNDDDDALAEEEELELEEEEEDCYLKKFTDEDEKDIIQNGDNLTDPDSVIETEQSSSIVETGERKDIQFISISSTDSSGTETSSENDDNNSTTEDDEQSNDDDDDDDSTSEEGEMMIKQNAKEVNNLENEKLSPGKAKSSSKFLKILKTLCCCCCWCCYPSQYRDCIFPLCFCEFLKSCMMVVCALTKEGVSLYFSSSEFLKSDDVDTSNPEYILLQNMMTFFQYVILVSILVYLFLLMNLILLYVGRFINSPLQFSVAYGSLKEFVVFRVFKSVFLIWFICVNAFCYILKFAYLDSYEKQKSLSDPMFWFSFLFPETLLIFCLWEVLAYNGVSSHAHLERLKKLGCLKGSVMKFPNVSITWGMVTKDPDVILEDFFQLIFLIEVGDKKKGEEMINKLSRSDEYGHLSWDMLDGLDIEEIFYLKKFFFPEEFQNETYMTIISHHRIASTKWVNTLLFFPVLCLLGYSGM